jgi:hypothetical protein
MQSRIAEKLAVAQATSLESAITIREAKFDTQEQNWLSYVAGGLFSKVKKTKDSRYYIAVY